MRNNTPSDKQWHEKNVAIQRQLLDEKEAHAKVSVAYEKYQKYMIAETQKVFDLQQNLKSCQFQISVKDKSIAEMQVTVNKIDTVQPFIDFIDNHNVPLLQQIHEPKQLIQTLERACLYHSGMAKRSLRWKMQYREENENLKRENERLQIECKELATSLFRSTRPVKAPNALELNVIKRPKTNDPKKKQLLGLLKSKELILSSNEETDKSRKTEKRLRPMSSSTPNYQLKNSSHVRKVRKTFMSNSFTSRNNPISIDDSPLKVSLYNTITPPEKSRIRTKIYPTTEIIGPPGKTASLSCTSSSSSLHRRPSEQGERKSRLDAQRPHRQGKENNQ